MHCLSAPQQKPNPFTLDIPARNSFLGGSDAERPKGSGGMRHGEQGKAREKPLRALGTSGSCLCPAAPAKLQNNGAQAAKPKSGAKNPWNVRPGAPGHTELPPQRGPFFCRERALGWQSASQPGFHTCARLPGTRGLDEDECQGKAAGLLGSLTFLGSNPGPASFNHAVSQFPHLENGANSKIYLSGSLRIKCVNRCKILRTEPGTCEGPSEALAVTSVITTDHPWAVEEELSPCDRHRNWGSESGRDLPRVTQLVKDRAGAAGPPDHSVYRTARPLWSKYPLRHLRDLGLPLQSPPDMLLPPWPSASLLLTWGVSQGDVGAWV